MAQSTRQTSLLVNQDWTKVYQSFTNADFTSYDFETLRSSMINYIKTYYPETFNDFLESSEYLALIDMIAFLGQSLAFRTDLNARENFIDTAQRRDSILKLARMLSYNPHRTTAAQGLLKIDSVKTTETITDSSGINLANATVHWNDLTNDNWLEQFTTIVNASLVSSEQIGKPGNSQLINNIQTDEYSINLNPNTLPVAPFQVNVQGTATGFEAVSATSVGESYIYADDPTKAGQFNILYQNDNNGNGSNNTGFFVFFKQGSLNSTTFNITNAIPNNFISVRTNNITNIDQWLYQLNVAGSPTTKWTPVPALPGINVIFNNLTDKNLYQVNTTNNDQVNLVFGDGAFANIPQGQFIFYYRTSNGTTFNVGPDDLSFVTIGFSYISQKNTVETLTITASLKYTVTNANSAPTTSSIRTLAPQQYYTQNRMVTGEDYNIFPVTSFSSIQKIKAVNRTSSGVSLFLDAIDPTGSYSATNIFGDDGSITANTSINSTTFSFLSINDIYSAIYNNVIPVLSKPEVRNYYYANVVTRYNSVSSNITFNQLSNSTSTSSGYLFMPNVAYTIGGNITYKNVTQQVGAGAITSLGNITAGASVQFTAPAGKYFDAQHVIKTGTPVNSGDSTSFYAAVTNVVSNGDVFTPSLVTFGTVVPEGAILSGPLLNGQSCIIPAYKNDLTSNVVTTLVSQIQAKSTFGLYYDQVQKAWENIPPSSISGNNNWALYFSYADGIYNLQYKVIDYIFSSSNDTNFYFDPAARVYDSITGKSVKDSIKILKINGLSSDITWDIYNTISGADGYDDPSRVLLTFPTTQLVGVPDNPDLYTIIASAIPSGTNIYFQYKHNAPARSRIDPTPINLIDLYILTASYTSSYISWLRDLTGSMTEPSPPTSSSLEIAYATLDNYKTVSDTIVYNPAKFKPLFGAKADPSVQARFQVVINPITGITENEIKTQTVSAINDYFDPSNWDFGDTFYFSELAAYLHTTLAPNLSSIIIVPASNSLVFGNYFQINSEPWEIITSAATVNDIEVVSAVTAATLNLGNTLLGTF